MTTHTHSWLGHRQSGLLAHISSLPGDFGIGNMGSPARKFIEFISSCGFAYWQICPAGPTGYGDSPYQSFSSYAGNPYFLDLNRLIHQGLLTEEETAPLKKLSTEKVDYGQLYERFWDILALAAERFDPQTELDGYTIDWKTFLEQTQEWLDAYSLFMGLKKLHEGKAWHQWDLKYKDFSSIETDNLPQIVIEEKKRHMVYQFFFFNQWKLLRDYAAYHNVQIIGDVPIFVAHDSADVWQHPEAFRIRKDGSLIVSAGVPPDYFSETGQYWGNPLYDWDYLKKTGYKWWLNRLNGAFNLYDVIRLDHFRAFSSFWEIPGGAPDARQGTWEKGPAMDFFDKVYEQFPHLKLIAEDLGYIDQAVYDLRIECALPGMKVIQFGFGHDTNNVNLPHFYPKNSVVYSGTHDNDTTIGWLSKLDASIKAKVEDYFSQANGCNAWTLIRAAFLSVSSLAVITMQDLLELGSEARMNTPGTAWGNWQWRFSEEALKDLAEKKLENLRQLHKLSDRTGDTGQHNFSASP